MLNTFVNIVCSSKTEQTSTDIVKHALQILFVKALICEMTYQKIQFLKTTAACNCNKSQCKCKVEVYLKKFPMEVNRIHCIFNNL